MKKVICLFTLIAGMTANVIASDIPVIRLNTAPPSATFDSIWVDYGVKENNVLGMRIHLSFSTYGMKDIDSYVAIYFEYNDDIAGFLKDKNKKYQSTDGDVAVYQNIKPAYDPADYKDLQLFMPYSELDLEPGIYDLTMDVKLIYKQGGIIQWLTYYDFEYTRPGSPADVESSTKADATLDKLWVDYNVTENGKKGMRIHVKFTAYNLKDVDGYVAIYFEKKNGEKIEGQNSEYRSKSGQLAVYKSIKPGYAEAVYDDLQLFMPYSEIKLGKGRFDLKLEADIILKNGDMVTHLKDHEFWLEQ
jgi:hypothetical protein